MVKFKMVKKLPTKLEDNDYVINSPDFVDEINEVPDNRRKTKDGNMLSTPNFLRKVVNQIGLRYGNENFNFMTACRVSNYDSIPYKDAEELSKKIIVPMFEIDYPIIFEDYITTKIKAAPTSTKIIYYVGNNSFAKDAFRKNGIEEIKNTTKKKNVV